VSTLPPILYFGNNWFSDNRTSSHHIARQLSRYSRLLYVEVPGLRPPAANSRDLRRLVTKVTGALSRHVELDGAITVRTLLQLPFHGSTATRALNGITSTVLTRAALRRERLTNPLIWCTVPQVSAFVEHIPRSLLVYHCIDDYSALPGVDTTAVRALDERLSLQADLMGAASRPVFEAKQHLRGNRPTLLMPHGVDVEHFGTARNKSIPEPPDLAGLPRPLIGFYGLIERWIDLGLVGWLAERMPQATFVMIGRVAVPRESVPQAPNIVYLGPKPYESLPSYGRFFDAAIIPYHLTDQVIAANPLKLREYLAMGLPVVSVSTPEIDRFADLVAVTRTREEFLSALLRALDNGRDDALTARRLQAVRESSWESRVREFVGHVETALSMRTTGR